jgi:hypothetical protein
MEQSSTLDVLEYLWKEYLTHLERVWYKAQAHYRKSPKWPNWRQKYEKERKNDPLLSYLRTARGKHEHTLEEITSQDTGSIQIAAGATGTGTVKNIAINNGVLSADVTSGTISIIFDPAKVRILPLVYRGRNYEVPKTHLGSALDPDNVIDLAKKGAEYYERFLNEAEEYFTTNNHS